MNPHVKVHLYSQILYVALHSRLHAFFQTPATMALRGEKVTFAESSRDSGYWCAIHNPVSKHPAHVQFFSESVSCKARLSLSLCLAKGTKPCHRSHLMWGFPYFFVWRLTCRPKSLMLTEHQQVANWVFQREQHTQKIPLTSRVRKMDPKSFWRVNTNPTAK